MLNATGRGRKTAISIALVGSVAWGGAMAGPASASSSLPAVASSSTTGVSGVVTNSAGSTPTPLVGAAKSGPGAATPNAGPAIAIRVAVRAGMAVLKRTSVSWYRAIISKVNQGRTAFVGWWDNSVPNWVKVTLGAAGGGVTGNAVYDALLWVLGLN